MRKVNGRICERDFTGAFVEFCWEDEAEGAGRVAFGGPYSNEKKRHPATRKTAGEEIVHPAAGFIVQPYREGDNDAGRKTQKSVLQR